MRVWRNALPGLVGTGVLGIGLACVGGPAGGLEISAEQALDHMRASFGWQAFAEREEGWTMRGTSHDQGLDGTTSQRLTPGGLFVSENRSELSSAQGFNGETVWAVDHTGMPSQPALSSRALLLGTEWVGNGVWLDPDEERFSVEVDNEATDERVLALSVRLPDSAFHCTVLVERESWLPKGITLHLPAGERVIELSEYAAPQGFQVATQIRLTGMSGEISTFAIHSITPTPLLGRNPYVPRTARPQDTRFARGVDPELADVQITRTGHILVRPKIERQDGGWFLLDSGAGMNCIDPGFADTLGLDPFGVVSVVGVGGVERSSFRRGNEYQLGPMTVRGTPWLELDLGMLEPLFGVEIHGVLGHETFSRAGIEIDLNPGRIWVQDPTNWTRPASGTKLVLDRNMPCVECSFAGDHSGWFRFDTGSDDTVTFHGPTVERYGLTEDRDDLIAVQMAGVGGTQMGQRGPIEWFELCGERFEQVPVTFLPLAAGVLNDAATLGNIGGSLVRGYRVSLDIPGGKLFLTPSE